MLYTKIFLYLTIVLQSVATILALRLIRTTKYNIIWILFIVGFTVLSVERYFQLIGLGGVDVDSRIFLWSGIVASVGLSIGVIYAHRLFQYVDRLNRQRQMVSRRILSAVLRTEERSRSRYSKELHDGLGPLLSSAKMTLSALDEDMTPDEKHEIVENTTYAIDEAIRALREISNNLSPQLLTDFGLRRALQTFINRNISNHNAIIVFDTNINKERYDSDVEVIFYRVICELINNSLKHAKCTRIDLSLIKSPLSLKLKYSDNGQGFDLAKVTDHGMGLSNITSRVNSLGGELKIISKKGEGMQALIKLSFEDETPPKRRKRLRHGKVKNNIG
ncbi:MAG: ATP-binding protein [Rikenellaceae bacterium]